MLTQVAHVFVRRVVGDDRGDGGDGVSDPTLGADGAGRLDCPEGPRASDGTMGSDDEGGDNTGEGPKRASLAEVFRGLTSWTAFDDPTALPTDLTAICTAPIGPAL